MAERKSGPVKPPVVELTARQVETPEAARKAAPGASKAADKPAPPSPPLPEQPAAAPPREPARKPRGRRSAGTPQSFLRPHTGWARRRGGRGDPRHRGLLWSRLSGAV